MHTRELVHRTVLVLFSILILRNACSPRLSWGRDITWAKVQKILKILNFWNSNLKTSISILPCFSCHKMSLDKLKINQKAILIYFIQDFCGKWIVDRQILNSGIILKTFTHVIRLRGCTGWSAPLLFANSRQGLNIVSPSSPCKNF